MSQQIYDIETVGFRDANLGAFFDFQVNNIFYLLAPEYYYQFYASYLRRCISVFDGWVGGFHNVQSGLVPQRALQSIAAGLANLLFANGIDFNGVGGDYDFATKWAKKVKLVKTLKKGYRFAVAGGTSLLKLNRSGKDLFPSVHRIDTFFVDVDASGKIVSVKVFFDAMHNTNGASGESHYGLCEERYFNEQGKSCVKTSIYTDSGNLQTSVASRLTNASHSVKWETLPEKVRNFVKTNYPDIIIGEEQYLPFPNSLGCYLIRFTEDIPQYPTLPLGQPIGDILFTESFQYDQMKYFEKNEVDLARARALVPEEMWNKDDPDYDSRALSERFYQKVSSLNGDSDKVTPIQFNLRGKDIREQKENIFKDMAFKLQVSASTIATFLSEGEGARTATEIVSERTKTDEWILGQIHLNAPEFNDMMKEVLYYYNKGAVEIIMKPQNQAPFNETLKTNGDQLTSGNMSVPMFVKMTYKNLSKEEQDREIKFLEDERRKKEEYDQATIQSWQK